MAVLDTKSAVLALDNENDNAKASAMMAAMKQSFGGIPVWLIGHAAKENLGHRDLKSSRGASAVDADAHQTIFVIVKNEKRYLVQGKTRFESKYPELEITSYTYETIAADEFGNLEPLTLRWGIAKPPTQSLKNAAEMALIDQENSIREEIISKVKAAWASGIPLNKTEVKRQIKLNNSKVVSVMKNLLSEGKLYQIFIPKKLRINISKSRFLISLTEIEQAAYLADGTIPALKKVIPESWRKPHD